MACSPESGHACPAFSTVVPAAGIGSRMGTEKKKPFLAINGHPIVLHTLARLASVPGCREQVLVVHRDELRFYRRNWAGALRLHFNVTAIVPGGQSRQESVWRGLGATNPDVALVLVHDAVRPLVHGKTIQRVAQRAADTDAAIAAVPAVATIKRVDDDKRIVETPARENLWMAQTPQGFDRELLLRAHRYAREHGISGTDDAGLVESIGGEVYVVKDSRENVKITTPEDTAIAETILQWQADNGLPAARLTIPGPETFPP